MKIQKNYQPLFSGALAFVLLTVFTLSTLATPQRFAQTANSGVDTRSKDAADVKPGEGNSSDFLDPASELGQPGEAPSSTQIVVPAGEGVRPETTQVDSVVVSPTDPSDSLATDPPMATLTARGQVMINGSVAQTGATVMTGSTVSTGSDGDAIIDIGPLGRIQLRPNTTINLVLSEKGPELTSQCGHTRISIVRGKASVRSGAKTTLAEGQDTIVDGPLVLNEAANGEVVVGCTQTPAGAGSNQTGSGSGPGGGTVTAGKIGLFAILAGSGVIAAGIATHGFQGSSSTSPQASPIQP